ncbi:MAG: hypothetical protein ACK5NK_01405 [Niabella sp.]
MSYKGRDIILLVKSESIDEEDIKLAMEHLHVVIDTVEKKEIFCNVHELVTRNRITRKSFKIMEAIRHHTLQPFYFLLNKN